ncbi:MAG: capsule biosynthesis protein [Marinibacterium sp.]|nr:capsule biosynthesis protein [Marinibacterium sp.]
MTTKPKRKRRNRRQAEGADATPPCPYTPRQLRLARRIADKMDLGATSDLDAAERLKARGIDPFRQTATLALVVDRPEHPQDGAPPAPVPVAAKPPEPALSPAERREQEIGQIQANIARRRRRKLRTLLLRLALFVGLPTAAAGWYYHQVATPLYATKSEFLILQADNAGGSGLGGLLSGTQFATSQDSIGVQSFLQSKEAMLQLDADLGFAAHFSDPAIDPIQRLAPDASVEDTYKTYLRHVTIGYDPTEGMIRMEVSATDPQVAAAFSTRLIGYAEDRVNALSAKKRTDQMQDALRSFEQAQADRRLAQQDLLRLQQQGAVLDPEGLIASLRSQISALETRRQDRELELAALRDNPRPNQARVQGVEADIARIETYLRRLNARMIDATEGETSLAELSTRIQMAQADLATRDLILQSALQQVEQTRLEANRQVRYLTTSVAPVPSEAPSYPRAFENTILAFLIFGGMYLMVSLTLSILREQVTS